MTDGSHVPGATAGDDISGLLQEQLKDRRARDAAETEAIDHAYQKHIFRARRKKPGSGWLTDEFLRHVHFDMFGDIWEWAGKYRSVPLNIGIEPHQIHEQVGILCGDFAFWDSEKSQMPPFEVAARLQNRLTRIHPFKNGNGRHARLITDIFFRSRKMRLPRWPQIQLLAQGDDVRKTYIDAMKKADQDDFGELIKFIERYCRREDT